MTKVRYILVLKKLRLFLTKNQPYRQVMIVCMADYVYNI